MVAPAPAEGRRADGRWPLVLRFLLLLPALVLLLRGRRAPAVHPHAANRHELVGGSAVAVNDISFADVRKRIVHAGETQWRQLLEVAVATDAGDSDLAPKCPELDDSNGRWQGSVLLGGSYTLKCAPGFQVKGHQGNRSWTLACPPELRWPEDLVCENVDDCANLKHGCGALGVCVDRVDGYDCNCEQGYRRRRSHDGEVVCGDKGADEEICGGHSCGAYGVCIDLRGNLSQFEGSEGPQRPQHQQRANSSQATGLTKEHDSTYRCECTDGFYDNGQSCVQLDCGELHDALGTWSGSTLFGGEYTLWCPENAYVWGGWLRQVTVSCGTHGRWLSKPRCISPREEAEKAEMETIRFWTCVLCIVGCILCAAMAAGLTLGLATVEPFNLAVILASRPEDCITEEERDRLLRDKANAQKVLPLVVDHHLLLVTLLLFNTVANEALPIFLDELLPSWAAVLVSVTVVLICGEIIPSAIFTGPNQFSIAATFVPFVRCLEVIFYPVARPISKALDRLIGDEEPEGRSKYSRAELRALIKIHGPSTENSQEADESQSEEVEAQTDEAKHAQGQVLSAAEVRLIDGTLRLRELDLSSVAYTRFRHCAVAGAQDSAVDVVARGALSPGIQAVIVTDGPPQNSGGSRQERSQLSDNSSRTVSRVDARLVIGCLRPAELLKGGLETLGALCLEPLVLIPKSATALDALRLLHTSSASMGVVVTGATSAGNADQPYVHGVISRTHVLSSLLLSGEGTQPRLTGVSSEALSPDELVENSPLTPYLGAAARNRRHPLARLSAPRPLLLRPPANPEVLGTRSEPAFRLSQRLGMGSIDFHSLATGSPWVSSSHSYTPVQLRRLSQS